MVITLLATRLDAGHSDGHMDPRVLDVLSNGDRSCDVDEAAADLGEHEVSTDERDLGVVGIDRPSPRCRQQGSTDKAGWTRGFHLTQLPEDRATSG